MSDDEATPLFRRQAVHAQQTSALGTVLLARPLSQSVFALFAAASIAAVVAFLAWGEFTRKARVNGWLVPEQGLVKVFATQAAVVSEVLVREGVAVKAGEPLLVLSAERRSAALGNTQAEITRLLGERRASLEAELRQQRQLFEQQRVSLASRIRAMNEEIQQLGQEIEFQGSRARLAEESLGRLRGLQKLGYVSLQQLQQQEEQALEQGGRLRSIERQRAERRRELAGLQAELDDLPLKSQALLAGISRSVAALDQELAEAEVRRKIVVPAPQSGTVAALQAETGSNVTPQTPLMSIVPERSVLEAHLFTPSRAIGFVREGQQVLLRYQAYPYQKFGHHLGTVATVSRTAISPGELPQQLAGMIAVVGTGEPVYRIVVRLERQTVSAYGEAQPLQAGMQLEADVVLEERKLYEWMLEPLYTLTGRL